MKCPHCTNGKVERERNIGGRDDAPEMDVMCIEDCEVCDGTGEMPDTEYGWCFFCNVAVPRETLRAQHGACHAHALNHLPYTGEPVTPPNRNGEVQREPYGDNPDPMLLAMPHKYAGKGDGIGAPPERLTQLQMDCIREWAERGDPACMAYLERHFGKQESVA